MDELDDIAGGNLYRLRRGVSRGNRGGGRGGRAGSHGQDGRGSSTRRGESLGCSSVPTMQFFNDTRGRRNQPTLVQAALSELRQVSRGAAANQGKRPRRYQKHKTQAGLLTPTHSSQLDGKNHLHLRKYASQNVPAGIQNPYTTGVLATQNEFTARMNIKPASVSVQNSTITSTIQTLGISSDITKDLGNLPSAASTNRSGPVSSKVLPTQPNPTPRSVVKTPFRGLATSKFASPQTQQEIPLPVNHLEPAVISDVLKRKEDLSNQETPTNISGFKHLQEEASTKTKSPLRVKTASVSKNPSVLIAQGHIKISLNGATPKFGRISLLKDDDSIFVILQVEVQDRIAIREHITDDKMFAYSASSVTFKTISKGGMPESWKFTFRLPNEAFAIWETWNQVAARADRGYPPTISAISNLLGEASGEAGKPCTSLLSAGTESLNTTYDLTNAPKRKELLIDFDHPEELNRIEEQEVQNVPSVMNMVVDEVQAKWILSLLDARPEGSFLQQVMKLAKFDFGREPTSKLFKAAEWVIKGYFMFSETFHQLPDDIMDAYVEESAKKVLIEAISTEGVRREAAPEAVQLSKSRAPSCPVDELQEQYSNVIDSQVSNQPITSLSTLVITEDISDFKTASPSVPTSPAEGSFQQQILHSDIVQLRVTHTPIDTDKQDTSLIEATETAISRPVGDCKVHRTGLSQSLADFHFTGEIEHESKREKSIEGEQHIDELKNLKKKRIVAEERLKKRGGLASSRFAPTNISNNLLQSQSPLKEAMTSNQTESFQSPQGSNSGLEGGFIGRLQAPTTVTAQYPRSLEEFPIISPQTDQPGCYEQRDHWNSSSPLIVYNQNSQHLTDRPPPSNKSFHQKENLPFF